VRTETPAPGEPALSPEEQEEADLATAELRSVPVSQFARKSRRPMSGLIQHLSDHANRFPEATNLEIEAVQIVEMLDKMEKDPSSVPIGEVERRQRALIDLLRGTAFQNEGAARDIEEIEAALTELHEQMAGEAGRETNPNPDPIVERRIDEVEEAEAQQDEADERAAEEEEELLDTLR
jgi:hypothetical protein